MSLEFPEKIRKIGHFSPRVIDREGGALYDIDIHLDSSQIKELNKRLKKHLKKSGYKNPIHIPFFQIPSINKGYSVIIGSNCVSIYPPQEKYKLKENEFLEFKKFLGEIEKVFQTYPPK